MRLNLNTNYENEFKFLKDSYAGAMNDMMFQFLRDEGYTGSLTDMLRQREAAGGGGGGGFSPADLSPQFWIDASNTSSITEVSGFVTQIDDLSGNNRHAVQATASKRPATGTTTINGLNVLAFDSGDIMRAPVAAGTFPSGLQATFVMQKTGANLTFEGPVQRTAGNLGLPYERRNNLLILGATNSNAYTNLRTFTTATVVSLEVGLTAQREFVNGAAGGSSAINNYTDTATEIQIGGRDDEVVLFRGNIGEIIFTDILSTTDREALETYLSDKWGIV